VVHGENPYGLLAPVPGLSFASVFSAKGNAPTIAYLPFWPLVTGLLYAAYSLVGFGNRFAYYFLLKQPEIAGDIILAYLLYTYVSSRKPEASKWVLTFWALSPFTIIISGIWGMFDALAMTFVMLSIMTAESVKSSFWAGMSIFVKSIPVIYAIPSMLRKTIRPWAIVLAGLSTALLSIVVIVAMGWTLSTAAVTLASTVGKGGESMSAWDLFFYLNSVGVLPSLPSLAYQVLGLVWIPALVVFTVIAYRKFHFDEDRALVQSLILVTLTFLIFKARIVEQYAVYLIALCLIDVALWNPQRKWLLQATLSVVMIYLIVNNYFLVRFLSPIYPGYVEIEASLSQAIGPLRDVVNLIAGTTFTILNVFYMAVIMRGKSVGN
jgi:hypothetical protein